MIFSLISSGLSFLLMYQFYNYIKMVFLAIYYFCVKNIFFIIIGIVVLYFVYKYFKPTNKNNTFEEEITVIRRK
jgi:uncharacterized membrane protein YuzA (DUF378 family)